MGGANMSHIVNDKNLDNLVEDIKGMTLQELLDDTKGHGDHEILLKLLGNQLQKRIEQLPPMED